MDKDFSVVKTQLYPLGVCHLHNGLHIAAVHRTIHTEDSAEFGIILYDRSHKGGVRIPFPEGSSVGSVYAMLLEGYYNREFSYLFYCGDRMWQDPYCRQIEHVSKYGVPKKSLARCLVPDAAYDWEDDRAPRIPYEDAVLYSLHVRGFTRHKSSGITHKGTYKGITEKLPYLKELGVTTLLLMPAYEFDEIQIQENTQTVLTMEQAAASYKQLPPSDAADGQGNVPAMREKPWKINYWGFRKGLYYCPKCAYASGKNAVTEFKDMVKALHRDGLEVLMQFYFPPEVAVTDMVEILKYWTTEYHIDGFQVLGENLPIAIFAAEPLLSETKILSVQQYDVSVSEHAISTRHVGRLEEGFLYDIRRLLKGDDNMINPLLYHVRNNHTGIGIINYIAKWEGMRLADLVSYDQKHNEANGEDNRDGTDYNCSWNCGIEGNCRRKQIVQLRRKQMKNAITMLFLAQGTPLLYSGDEFGNTQNGNNNPYCQDNDTAWIKWNPSESGRQLLDHTKMLIRLRREHPILHSRVPLKGMDFLSCGYPDISFHGKEAWRPDTSPASRTIGIMYCGYYGEIDGHRDDDFIYFGINLHWQPHTLGLPKLPRGKVWKLCSSTAPEEMTNEQPEIEQQEINVLPRTIVIYTTKDCPVPDTGQGQRRRHRKPSKATENIE